MRRARLVAALLLSAMLGPGPAFSASQVSDPASPVVAAALPTPAATGVAFDGRRSSAVFGVSLRMRGLVQGHIPGVAGQLAGSRAAGWQVQARLDAQGLHFDGPHWMERTTRSSSFLAVDRYPSIRFDSDRFDDALLRSGGPLHGELTLRGLRRPVSFVLLPSSCARPGTDCDIRVQGSLSRREFGMTAYRMLADDTVELGLRVRLRGSGTAP